ncbi:Metallo-hydrolase/oxidoreductase [Canariomyces notabilis]|uniref:Metallo-hydrolase/oxidoreductase n=1 Tax=Canariomyces notabilis TaxID=2074819 RepID=A0AAN6TAA7_9PEZI|nr:Metallo-hydrolase/oxidoreductase [Canariomyces arenarius]
MPDASTKGVPAPELNIPPSSHTVDVSIINTTSSIRGIPTSMFFDSPVEGHDWLGIPIYSFLIQHPTLNRSLLFDLGIRKDWTNLSPFLLSMLKTTSFTMHVEKDVREILDEAGVDTANVEAIVWSHWHWDHAGNPNTFGPNTKLIVGPGFKENMLPGYPANPQSPILEEDYANRELVEVDFSSGLTIGRFRAHDYFGDGSFYLLDSPGHAVGHLSALARVNGGRGSSAAGSESESSSFILLSGDAFHHVAEIRPSKYLPLPEQISPDPFQPAHQHDQPHHASSCPGAMFESLLTGRGRPSCGPFYEPAKLERPFHADLDALRETKEKMMELDAQENILVASSHDEYLPEVVDMFPEGKLNEFKGKGWVRRLHWRFLRDFARAVGKEDSGEKRDWSPVKGQEERGEGTGDVSGAERE